MRTNQIYLSDLFSVPVPKHTLSRRTFRKKLFLRKLLWAALPYLLQAVLLTITLALMMGGLSILLCGLGS